MCASAPACAARLASAMYTACEEAIGKTKVAGSTNAKASVSEAHRVLLYLNFSRDSETNPVTHQTAYPWVKRLVVLFGGTDAEEEYEMEGQEEGSGSWGLWGSRESVRLALAAVERILVRFHAIPGGEATLRGVDGVHHFGLVTLYDHAHKLVRHDRALEMVTRALCRIDLAAQQARQTTTGAGGSLPSGYVDILGQIDWVRNKGVPRHQQLRAVTKGVDDAIAERLPDINAIVAQAVAQKLAEAKAAQPPKIKTPPGEKGGATKPGEKSPLKSAIKAPTPSKKAKTRFADEVQEPEDTGATTGGGAADFDTAMAVANAPPVSKLADGARKAATELAAKQASDRAAAAAKAATRLASAGEWGTSTNQQVNAVTAYEKFVAGTAQAETCGFYTLFGTCKKLTQGRCNKCVPGTKTGVGTKAAVEHVKALAADPNHAPNLKITGPPAAGPVAPAPAATDAPT